MNDKKEGVLIPTVIKSYFFRILIPLIIIRFMFYFKSVKCLFI